MSGRPEDGFRYSRTGSIGGTWWEKVFDAVNALSSLLACGLRCFFLGGRFLVFFIARVIFLFVFFLTRARLGFCLGFAVAGVWLSWVASALLSSTITKVPSELEAKVSQLLVTLVDPRRRELTEIEVEEVAPC